MILWYILWCFQYPYDPAQLWLEFRRVLFRSQSYTEVDELAWLGAVYDQDTSNLQLQQQGLKNSRKGITLGNYQEARIRRFHLTLDHYLAQAHLDRKRVV